MECLSYCIAGSIDLTHLDSYIKTNHQEYISSRSRDVLRLSPKEDSQKVIFIFKNGTVVSWAVKRHCIGTFLSMAHPFCDRPVSILVRDEFSFKFGDRVNIEPHQFFDVDCLTIDSNSEELRLSLSYGFSQSVKLQYFETIIDTLIEKYNPIIQNLSNEGKMLVSRKRIKQVIGEILGAKSEMNLISNFLYHPKYFWQHPTLEEYYTMMERYLHIQRRVNAINHRLDTLNEIFEMFNSYLEIRHSHGLEIIIIVLIAIEILFAVLNIHF